MKRVRVRFAPSPTGPLHMGGVRTALYNYLFAKKHGGDFLLRIEDTDQTRLVEGAEEYIINALNWCGIPPNEGVSVGGEFAPYKQSERKYIYKPYAQELVEKGFAYYAFDSSQALEEMRTRLVAEKVLLPQYNHITRKEMQNSLTLSSTETKHRIEGGEQYVIRLKMPVNEEIKVNDLIRGEVVVNSSQLDDKVLFKSDGMPTYHLAHLVDDYLMNISHVIRGEEWLPSAPTHILLYKYLGWEEVTPEFAHLPLILKPDGNGKLSKRDGDRLGFPSFPLTWKDPASGETSQGYKERGFYPQAFINMLAFLGWNPGTTQEIFNMQELIDAFSIEQVSRRGAKFDFEKAKWYNQQYLRARSNDELAKEFLIIICERIPDANHDKLDKICGLLKEKTQFVNEFWNIGSFFFIAPQQYDADTIKKKWNENSLKAMNSVLEDFSSLVEWNHLQIETTFKIACEKVEVSPGSVQQLFRVFLTGLPGGPALWEIAEILGKEEVINRIKTAINLI